MKTKLGMEFYIDYSHMLLGHPTCGQRHGHTARILVEITGDVKAGDAYQENMIMDFQEMKDRCKSVLTMLDHKDLNDRFSFPTSENIASWVFAELKKQLPVSNLTFFEGNGKWCTVEE